MGVLHTLRKRNRDPAKVVFSALDQLAADSEADSTELLLGSGPAP